MQTYDLLMLLVLVGATMFGFWKGMAWQIASLASLVVSYFAALRFSEQLAPMFGEHAPLNRFVAMLVIYIGTSFVIWMLFRLVSGAIDKVRLESFDKQLGAMFGFAKGVLLCVAITFFAVTLLPPAQGEAIVGSQSGQYIVALLDKSHSVFPPEIHQIDRSVSEQGRAAAESELPAARQRVCKACGRPGADRRRLRSSKCNWPQLPQLPQINWPQAAGRSQPSRSSRKRRGQPILASRRSQQSTPQPQSNPYQRAARAESVSAGAVLGSRAVRRDY